MGQIIGGAAKPKRCNLNKLSQLGTPAAGEYILISSDNSMNAAGQGHFDCYIKGDNQTPAPQLPIVYFDQPLIDDELALYYILQKTYGGLVGLRNEIADTEELIAAEALTDLDKRVRINTKIADYSDSKLVEIPKPTALAQMNIISTFMR